MGKRLGQHFLINNNQLRKIAGALELKPGETIIEIGPGHGELTESIKYQAPNIKIIAIEKDGKLVQFLREKFSSGKGVEIMEGDALKILPEITKPYTLNAKPYKIAGNIPYYITGHLLRVIADLENKPVSAVLTVQKEVAERICAKPPKMNLLAASVLFWAEPEIAGFVPKRDFNPAPKVGSAIIKLLLKIDAGKNRLAAEKYYKFIKILFKQPRKTVLNNLAASVKSKNKEEISEKLAEIGVDPESRPERLDIGQINELSTFF